MNGCSACDMLSRYAFIILRSVVALAQQLHQKYALSIGAAYIHTFTVGGRVMVSTEHLVGYQHVCIKVVCT